MAEVYKLLVHDTMHYESYIVEQLEKEVDDCNAMISKVREHRAMLMGMLNYKREKDAMQEKLAAMSPMQKQALMHVLGLDTIPSSEMVNA